MDTHVNDMTEMEALVQEVAGANADLRAQGTTTLEDLYAEFRAIDLAFAGLPQKVEQILD